MPIEDSKKIHSTPVAKSTTPVVTVDASSVVGRMRMDDIVLAAAAAQRDTETKKLSKEKAELEALDKNLGDQIKALTNVVNKL